MILASSIFKLLADIVMGGVFLLLVLTPIIVFIVGMGLMRQDNKTRRRIENQERQTPNITITFRRDA